MDFATEEKLCRHAHEVWRQVAAEPDATAGTADMGRATGHDLAASLHLPDVFACDGQQSLAW